MHLDDGMLRALIDRELENAQTTTEHLATCSECSRRLDELRGRAGRVQTHLAALEPDPREAPRPTAAVYDQFRRASQSERQEQTMLKNIFSARLRPLWVGLCALVVMTVAFSFPPVRAWASDLLAQFRVKQITVIQVDNTRLTELIGNTALAKQISQLVSDSMNVTREPGQPRAVANAAEASRLAGFSVRLPTSRSDAPELSVQGGAEFDFVVNRARAQTLLNEAGASSIQLPPGLDGARIKVSIPTGVSAAYGDCPKLADSGNATGSPGRRFAKCIMLIEIPSPTVETPPDLDVQQLAEMGLEFTGMNADQARAFSRQVDWTSTLVIPVPRNGASYKEIQVDGANGYLIQRPSDDVPQYLVTWTKDGIIYAVGGMGSDTAVALSIANSLQ